jgi:hypothetical protein
MPDTSYRVSGTVYLSIDGQSYPLVGDFTWDPAMVSRETVVGQDGVHGYSEKPKAPSMKGKLRDLGGLSVGDINGLTNVTLTGELANGKLIVGRNMWQVGDLEVASNDGTYDVAFEGPQGAVTEN